MSPAETAGAGQHRVALSLVIERLPSAVITGDVSGVEITAVTFDHRDVVAGALHCCLPGVHADGRAFAPDARRSGAVAFLCEAPLDPAVLGGPYPPVQVLVPAGTARAAMAAAACAFAGDPAASLEMIGVTGTNGKTTVTHLCQAILAAAGHPAAIIGTLGGVRTTPEAPVLQGLLAGVKAAGDTAVAMEVTSHAMVQHRADGIIFDVAVFTNLTQDHLDFHGTMEDYFAAKSTLFRPEHAGSGVVCADDPYGRRLLEGTGIPLTPYGLDEARELVVGAHASRFVLDGHEVRLNLGGAFNVLNALGAAAACRALGVAPADIAAGLSAAAVVPGRFEPVPNERGISVVVDYAHTPDALSAVLAAARGVLSGEAAGGRVILVFGCGGDRDRAKRPLMGHVATTAADIAIVTSDNPRSEDPGSIIEAILEGCDGPAKLVVEADRTAAIGEAISLAGAGDIVILAGKGHETTQEFSDHSVHFDDREVAAALLGAGAAAAAGAFAGGGAAGAGGGGAQ